jgi:putative AbiEi antitoxin of type IV toxin-antitoxin system/uncharacterized protein DUF559
MAIAELADRQHGVVARSQLLERGVGRRAIARRLEAMHLRPLHRGVYAVGHRQISQLGRCMAAVLACGPGAVLSHRCAAVLWGILESWPSTIDITAPRELRSRDALRVRRAWIADDERTVEGGIPVTTVARTLLDLAAVLDLHQLNRALERAEALRLSDALPLAAVVARHRGRRGTANLKAAMKEGIRPVVTKSELERRFLTFIDKAGLPRPRTNVWLQIGDDWIEVDCVWDEQRLIVELDSRAYHRTTAAFERDRRRDRRIQAAGWRPIRITDKMLRTERATLVADVRALVSAAPARSA